MEFWASSESYAPVDADIERVRQCVEPYMKDALGKSSMANLDMTIRYVPIVMPNNMHDRYKERSRASIKQKIYDCAPRLNYDLFVSGEFCDQVSEYIRGIALSVPYLKKFGLSDEQIEEFSDILAGAIQSISERRPDQTRH